MWESSIQAKREISKADRPAAIENPDARPCSAPLRLPKPLSESVTHEGKQGALGTKCVGQKGGELTLGTDLVAHFDISEAAGVIRSETVDAEGVARL